MSTSVKVINFGPRAVRLYTLDQSVSPPAREIETLYLYGVSREVVLHDSQSLMVAEVPEVKPAPDPQWREPIPVAQAAMSDPLVALAIAGIASGELSAS